MELDLALAASQGGGLYITYTGTATLINTNVYSNQAASVCLHLELSLNSHPSPR